MKQVKLKNMFEQSFDDTDEEPDEEAEIELPEQEKNIGKALEWKRRHFFVNCFFIAVFFMLKLEFSYTDAFGNNIIMFQIFFTFLDIFIEQLITRIIMGEALMATPLLSVFTSLEFVMTMGANDF